MKILVFGSNGLVGKSIVRRFNSSSDKYTVIESTRNDTDLFSYKETSKKIGESNPDIVIIAAAKVGGIYANNTQRFSFIIENLKISMNIFESLVDFPNVKIVNIGSSCIYPLNADSPISEESLMTGKLEPTNSPYSMAKLSSLEIAKTMEEQFGHKILNLMPTNLYGPNDRFEEFNSHVIPGLIYKMHKGKISNSDEVEIWGSGSPLREFMHVDDLSSAIDFLLETDSSYELLNIGSNEVISIKELAKLIKKIVKYDGDLKFNSSFPDGNPKKLLDSTKVNKLGWKSNISLEKGIQDTYDWYVKNID
jgi:GDP-L-fucose synthase|tara:strand:- start:1197 stop:2117 length:921 start_codon:yes stop_codon:yes gene_type:complete